MKNKNPNSNVSQEDIINLKKKMASERLKYQEKIDSLEKEIEQGLENTSRVKKLLKTIKDVF